MSPSRWKMENYVPAIMKRKFPLFTLAFFDTILISLYSLQLHGALPRRCRLTLGSPGFRPFSASINCTRSLCCKSFWRVQLFAFFVQRIKSFCFYSSSLDNRFSWTRSLAPTWHESISLVAVKALKCTFFTLPPRLQFNIKWKQSNCFFALIQLKQKTRFHSSS